MTRTRRRWWAYGQVLILPLLLWAIVIGLLWEPVRDWLSSGEAQDKTILREWLNETRGNLRGMVEDYLKKHDLAQSAKEKDPDAERELFRAREKIRAFLESLGTPPKMYSGTLPLFPTIYRIEVAFEDDEIPAIFWDSLLPTESGDYDELRHHLTGRSHVELRYQLHAYDKRQSQEAQRAARVRQLSLLAVVVTGMALAWVIYVQRREREQQRKQAEAAQQVDQAERRRQEAERDLLQQKLAAQEYEQKMLEMKSQLYASIGIMAGSYAHNIKNLLVRPNDLLRRCLEDNGLAPEKGKMLTEVRETLGTVTERLQQILQTVRRDPSKSEMERLDLRAVLQGLGQTWRDLAWERWKLQLAVEAGDKPLWVDGDLSHLQQAVENLLFNARDATFEMRVRLREEARKEGEGARRQALIAAAAWKGNIVLRGFADGDAVVLEVRDNGIGMTEEVRQRCTETHFSTKRDNAIFEGHSTGMGLGLSFVKVVLDNHRAKLEIDSAPMKGTTFRVRFPVVNRE